MKKLVLGSLLAMGLVSSASADFVGASVGAGLWDQDMKGYVKSGDDINYFNDSSAETDRDNHTGNFGFKSGDAKPFVWLKFIHPIPIIPNFKAEYRQYDFSGDGVLVGSTKIFGQTISANDRAHSDLKINSYDLTLFYEFKPVVADIEAGVGVNVWDGNLKVKTTTTSIDESFTAPIPYVYARVETMKLLGFAVEGQGKYLEVSKAHFYDYDVGLKYYLPIPVLDLSAKIGYKSQELSAEDGDDKTVMKFEGAYAEVAVKW